MINKRQNIPFMFKIHAAIITIIICICLFYSILKPFTLSSVLLGVGGIFVLYSVCSILFAERMKYYILLSMIKDNPNKKIHPIKEKIKGYLVATFILVSLWLNLPEATNSILHILCVGTIGITIFIIIHTGLIYRWLIMTRFSNN